MTAMNDDWRNRDRAEVEAIASGKTSVSGRVDVAQLGQARAEIVRRDHEYAEEQERSRRQYEDDRAAARREHEEQLLRRQMEHASKLAQEQLDTARAAQKAANRAAWAGGASRFWCDCSGDH